MSMDDRTSSSLAERSASLIPSASVIEAVKENILPLKGGRKATVLAATIASTDPGATGPKSLAAPMQAMPNPPSTPVSSLAAQRAALEACLASPELAEHLDPLKPHLDLIRWIVDHYPQGNNVESGLIAALERTLERFKDDSRYKRNSLPFLNLCVMYASLVKDPEEVYKWMAVRGIGQDLSVYYESYAELLEKSRNYSLAKSTLQLGVNRRAQPIARMQRLLAEFCAREEARERRRRELIELGEEPELEPESVRSVLGAAAGSVQPRVPRAGRENAGTNTHGQHRGRPNGGGGLVDATGRNQVLPPVPRGPRSAPSNTAMASAPSQPGNAKWVFSDPAASTRRASGSSDGSQAAGPWELGTARHRVKENVRDVESWRGVKMPAEQPEAEQAPAKTKLQVWQDEDCAGFERRAQINQEASNLAPPSIRERSGAGPAEGAKSEKPRDRSGTSSAAASKSHSADGASAKPKKPERYVVSLESFYPTGFHPRAFDVGAVESAQSREEVRAKHPEYAYESDGDDDEKPTPAGTPFSELPAKATATSQSADFDALPPVTPQSKWLASQEFMATPDGDDVPVNDSRRGGDDDSDASDTEATKAFPMMRRLRAATSPTINTRKAMEDIGMMFSGELECERYHEDTLPVLAFSRPMKDSNSAGSAGKKPNLSVYEDPSDSQPRASALEPRTRAFSVFDENEVPPAGGTATKSFEVFNDDANGEAAVPLKRPSQVVSGGMVTAARKLQVFQDDSQEDARPSGTKVGAGARLAPLLPLGRKPQVPVEDDDNPLQETGLIETGARKAVRVIGTTPGPRIGLLFNNDQRQSAELQISPTKESPTEDPDLKILQTRDDVQDEGFFPSRNIGRIPRAAETAPRTQNYISRDLRVAQVPDLTPISEATETSIRTASTNASRMTDTERSGDSRSNRKGVRPSRSLSIASSYVGDRTFSGDVTIGSTLSLTKHDLKNIEEEPDEPEQQVDGGSVEGKRPGNGELNPSTVPSRVDPMDPNLWERLMSDSSMFEDCCYYENTLITFNHAKSLERFASRSRKESESSQSNMTITFPSSRGGQETSFEITAKLGQGGFASVYKAQTLEDDPFLSDLQESEEFALKLLTPPGPAAWEFYVLRLLHARLRGRFALSVVQPYTCHVFRDEAWLKLEFCEGGTLLSAVNAAAGADGISYPDGGLDEQLAMFWTVEVLKNIEAWHACGVIHGDVKADNVMLRWPKAADVSARVGTEAWSPQYDPAGRSGWDRIGIKVLDFGRAVAVGRFPPGTGFDFGGKDCTGADSADVERKGAKSRRRDGDPSVECWEMRNGASWSYEADWYGAAGIASVLVFGKYMEVKEIDWSASGSTRRGGEFALDFFKSVPPSTTTRDRTSPRPRVATRVPVRRNFQVELWTKLFDILLNAGQVHDAMVEHLDAMPGASELPQAHFDLSQLDKYFPATRAIRAVRREMEDWLVKNSVRGSNREGSKPLKTLLRNLEIKVKESKMKSRK